MKRNFGSINAPTFEFCLSFRFPVGRSWSNDIPHAARNDENVMYMNRDESERGEVGDLKPETVYFGPSYRFAGRKIKFILLNNPRLTNVTKDGAGTLCDQSFKI